MADPTTPATTGMSAWDQILPWIQFAASYQESKKSGTFVQPPMSPQQQQMFDWALHYIQATPDNRQTINAALGYDLAHPATLDMNALREGKTGYTPAAHMPGVDLAALLRNGSTGASPSSPAAPSVPPSSTAGNGSGSGPTGIPGDPFGSISSPAGSRGDPFAGVSGGGGGTPTDWSQLKSAAERYGPAAGSFVLSLVTSNPYMAVAAGYKALQAYLAGRKEDPQLPVKNPNYPQNELTPGGPTTPSQAPRQDWSQPHPDPWAGQFTAGYQNAPGQVGFEGGGGGGGYRNGYDDSDMQTRTPKGLR